MHSIEQLLEQVKLNETFAKTSLVAWGILLGGIFLGLAGGKLAQAVIRGVAKRMSGRGWAVRGTAVQSIAGPAYLLVFACGLTIGLAAVFLAPEVRKVTDGILKLLYIAAIAWFLYDLVELIDLALRHFTKKTSSKLDDQVVPLIRKTLRLFLVIVFVLFTAQNVFGANITAWLAGLGIAGLAVSLAAQDSIKNLFGSLTIFMDRPFAVGEKVKFGGYEGWVEEIGFRSTRLRTVDGTLVTIPNSKIVDSDVENLARRPHIRRVLNVGALFDTPVEKMREGVTIIKRILEEPEIAEDLETGAFSPKVMFNELNADSSLNILVTYWFKGNDNWAQLANAEKVNLRLMQEFNEAGIESAFPMRQVLIANDAKRELGVRVVQEKGPK